MPYVPTCLAYLRTYVPTCLACIRANVSCVLTCQRALRAYVPTCLACLRANLPCVLFCANVPARSRAITPNNKKKFSVICFAIVLSFFSCEINFSGQIAFFEIFHPQKHFIMLWGDPPKLKITPPPCLITSPSVLKLLGKTFKCKIKIMGENQIRKLK